MELTIRVHRFSTDVSEEGEEVSSSQFDSGLTSDGEAEVSLLLVQGQPIIVRTYAWSSQTGSYVFSFEIQEMQGKLTEQPRY